MRKYIKVLVLQRTKKGTLANPPHFVIKPSEQSWKNKTSFPPGWQRGTFQSIFQMIEHMGSFDHTKGNAGTRYCHEHHVAFQKSLEKFHWISWGVCFWIRPWVMTCMPVCSLSSWIKCSFWSNLCRVVFSSPVRFLQVMPGNYEQATKFRQPIKKLFCCLISDNFLAFGRKVNFHFSFLSTPEHTFFLRHWK